MGLIEDNLARAIAKEQEALTREAESIGASVEQLEVHRLEAATVGKALAHGVSELLGSAPRPNILVTLRLNRRNGPPLRVVLALQNQLPLPAELYGDLPGRLAAPAVLEKGILWGANWRSPDEQLQQTLKSDPALKAAAKALSFTAKFGLKELEHDWVVQLRPLAQGTRLVLRTARYGGLLKPRLGLAELSPVVEAIAALATESAAAEEHGWLEAPSYEAQAMR